jgi:hypothetical protein
MIRKLIIILVVFFVNCVLSQDSEEVVSVRPISDYKFLFGYNSLKIQDSDINKPNGLIIFKANISICSLYSKDCKISILINNNLSDCDLDLSSENTNIVEVRSIKLCQENCANFEEYVKPNMSTNYFANNYKVYDINLDTVLIGLTTIQFKIKNSSKETSFKDIKFPVLILQPMRFIDKVFHYYAMTFVVLISLTMGILLDVEALKKIIKIPIPVCIGLGCQFILMPLV